MRTTGTVATGINGLPGVVTYDGTMGSSGCFTTAIAMGLSTVSALIDPANLNNQMKTPYGPMPKLSYYYNDNGIIGQSDSNKADQDALKDFSNGKILAVKDITGSSSNGIKTELDNCNIVLAQVKFAPASLQYGHWAWIKAYKGNTYYAYDPIWGERTFTLADFQSTIYSGATQ